MLFPHALLPQCAPHFPAVPQFSQEVFCPNYPVLGPLWLGLIRALWSFSLSALTTITFLLDSTSKIQPFRLLQESVPYFLDHCSSLSAIWSSLHPSLDWWALNTTHFLMWNSLKHPSSFKIWPSTPRLNCLTTTLVSYLPHDSLLIFSLHSSVKKKYKISLQTIKYTRFYLFIKYSAMWKGRMELGIWPLSTICCEFAYIILFNPFDIPVSKVELYSN